MAILKHIASKNADYGKSLEYLMFEHTENGRPVRNADGDMIMRDQYLLEGINCNPYSYDKECEMLNAQYHKNQKYSDIKSHHYIISFDPEDCAEGKLTLEMAQKMGMDFARRHFPGHQILVCTHTDGHNESGNIHVHVIFNSVRKLDVEKQPYMERARTASARSRLPARSVLRLRRVVHRTTAPSRTAHEMERDIDCRAGYKHHLTKGYLEYLQTEVMEMCEREGLRQVDLLSPAKSRITDEEYRVKQRGQKKLDALNEEIIAAKMTPRTTVFQTQRQFLREAILDVAAQAASMDKFQKLLKEKYGIEVKESRGRLSYLHPERSKYISGHALGSDYEKDHIEQMLKSAEKQKDYDPSYDYHADPVAILYVRSSLRLVVNLQNNIKAQQSAAYARKVKLSNLKEMARTVVYVQEHGYDTVDDLQTHQQQIFDKKEATLLALAQTNASLKKVNEQIHFTGQYYTTRQIQGDFLKTRFKKKYREEHRTELEQYQKSLSFFKEQCDGKIPSMKNLKSEKEKLLALQRKQQKELSRLNQIGRELQTATVNVATILHFNTISGKQKSRHQPEL